jgi:integrase
MRTIDLTTKALKNIKTPASGRTEYRIADHGGLFLLVGQHSRSWILRHSRKGRRQVLKLRDYVAGENLRQVAADASARLAEMSAGADLAAQRRSERAALTINGLAKEYLRRHPKRASSLHEDEKMLAHDILPTWADRKVASITRHDVIELLDGLVDRGLTVKPNRVRALLSKLFNFALGRGVAESNPIKGIAKPSGQESPRERKLTDDEIRTLWTVLDDKPEHLADLYRTMTLTAARPGEVMRMRFDELDLERGTWTLPGDRAKNHQEHIVPLCGQVLEILRRRRASSGDNEFVFPGRRTGASLVSLGKVHAGVVAACGFEFQIRDLRRTAATRIAAAGAGRFVVARILNHSDRSITAVYDKYSYEPEMRRALERWSRELGSIVEPEAVASTVVQMRA